jgi:hypothetical protein
MDNKFVIYSMIKRLLYECNATFTQEEHEKFIKELSEILDI